MSSQVAAITNSDVERHYFEQFRKRYLLPAGTVEYGDRPDVRVLGQRTTGIEITNFYLAPGHLPGSEQNQKRLREGIVADAHTIYRAAGGGDIGLVVGFNLASPIAAKTRRSLAARLATFVSAIETRASGEVYRSLYADALPELDYIYLIANHSGAEWRVQQVYGVNAMPVDRLEAIICDKEAKAISYRSCDALWLLIVVGWIDPAQEQEIRVDGLLIQSKVFEKIIIYKPNFEHIVELS